MLNCKFFTFRQNYSKYTHIFLVCANLIRQNPTGPQAETWNFLWGFISQADLFISHPIHNFVPDNVPQEKVVLLPACTDPLDGLNKGLRHTDLSYYKLVYNR